MPVRFSLFLLILFGLPAWAFTQQRRMGGILPEDDRYRQHLLRVANRASKPGGARSLRDDFTIPALDQGFVPACGCCAVAQAFSIRRKQYFDRECPGDHPLEVFSWSYLFNLLCPPDSCESGIYLADALDLLVWEGICPADSFPNNRYGCDPQPGIVHKTLAARHKIWKWKRVFSLPEETGAAGDTARMRQFRDQLVQTAIAEIDQDNPIIVAVFYAGDYDTCDRLFSTPRSDTPSEGHAMLLTGYDDRNGTFELLNSFGPEWCEEGYVRVRYDDFARVVRYGYVLLMDEQACR